ncbi:dolichyl-phosphate mannosyltransferase [Cordyceps militaris CM01]|uniref:Dolichol phosphate-mannose biosynthesis regulatory protein n=1 Tax=Cordyceps militaris (strain CM01) TaxID=983644 RepID=G3J7J8_CORMM|nr:dolichyl-phosphate mannosyltransferase [Cordyceps militaris CM01]EGX97164.1 dolichyl-phosphate mannosyltransferase [Cordyceps militaris CM01]
MVRRPPRAAPSSGDVQSTHGRTASPSPECAPRKDVEKKTRFDKLVGLAMLVAATVVFLYYTVWTLLMPSTDRFSDFLPLAQPFVDDDHPLQNFFLPRVWAIRIPVILILIGSAVVGSFLGMVMIRSNRKKAAKAKAAAASKKKA